MRSAKGETRTVSVFGGSTRRLVAIAGTAFALIVVPIAVAGSESSAEDPRARASASVKKKIKKLKQQLAELQGQVDTLARQPGPQGPQGPRGEQGEQGEPGLSTGPAGGELAGTYPNPEIGTVNGLDLGATSSSINFEGSTADPNETTLSANNPTADRTATLPNASGEVSLLGQSIQDSEVDNDLTISGGTINGTSVGATTASTAAFTNLTIGGGTQITEHRSGTATDLPSDAIGANACGEYESFSVTGAAVGDTVVATPDPASSADGIEDNNLIWNAAVTAANQVTIRACNPTGSVINTTNDQEWRADVWGH